MACIKPKNETNESSGGAITYPDTGLYGDNILSDKLTVLYTNTDYSMKAEVPKNANLKIVLKDWEWFYGSGTSTWGATDYDDATMSQQFMVLVSGKPNDLDIEFSDKEHKPTYTPYHFFSPILEPE